MLASIYVVSIFPKPEAVPHSYELCKQLKPETKSKIFCAEWEKAPIVSAKPSGSESQSELQALWDSAKRIEQFDPSTATLLPGVRAPNGHLIQYAGKLSTEELKSIVDEYSDLLDAKANRAKVDLVLRAFAFWLCSSLIVYCFGWSVGWVYHGFKKLE